MRSRPARIGGDPSGKLSAVQRGNQTRRRHAGRRRSPCARAIFPRVSTAPASASPPFIAMRLSDYQAAALRTRNPALDDAGRLLDPAAGLAEEAGEVLGAVRKHLFQGRALDRAALAEEMGDALWCIAVLADGLGLSLDEVAGANLEKLRRRHPHGFTAGGQGSPDSAPG